MGLPQEAIDRRIFDVQITDGFLRQHNLQVTKHFEIAPVWTIEPIEPAKRGPEPPIILTRLEDKQHDTLSLQINRSFSELTRQQQILSVFYLGQLSYEQGSLESVTLTSSLRPQTIHTIVDVLQYSRKGNYSQLIIDLADDNGWLYMRFPQG